MTQRSLQKGDDGQGDGCEEQVPGHPVGDQDAYADLGRVVVQ